MTDATDKSEFNKNILEQYKICIEMADRVSSRRLLANNMYLAIIAALSIAYTIGPDKLGTDSKIPLHFILSIVSLMLSILWYTTITYYSDINGAKYQVINSMEIHLPAKAFTTEWVIFKTIRNERKVFGFRFKLSSMETIMPMATFVLSIVSIVYETVNTTHKTASIAYEICFRFCP